MSVSLGHRKIYEGVQCVDQFAHACNAVSRRPRRVEQDGVTAGRRATRWSRTGASTRPAAQGSAQAIRDAAGAGRLSLRRRPAPPPHTRPAQARQLGSRTSTVLTTISKPGRGRTCRASRSHKVSGDIVEGSQPSASAIARRNATDVLPRIQIGTFAVTACGSTTTSEKL